MEKKNLVLIFLLIVLLIALLMAYRIALPFLKPVAFASILAISVYPLHKRLTQRVKWPGVAALVSTLGIILFFAIPLSILLVLASNEAIEVANRIAEKSESQGGFASMALSFLDRPLNWLSQRVDISRFDLKAQLMAQVNGISMWLLKTGAALLGNFAEFIGSALIAFLTLFFLLRDGEKIVQKITSFIPLQPVQAKKLLQGIEDSIVANVYGILAVGAAQGLLTGIAMKIAGIQSAILLGMAAMVCSLIPIAGTAIVWIPAAAYLFITGHIWQGVFLVLWGSIVVASADNIIRPLVIAGRVQIHPLLLLFALIGGASAFGFLGLFIGPIVVSVLAALIEIFPEALQEGRTG
jgi:predicted PurR-regulated permease PerM